MEYLKYASITTWRRRLFRRFFERRIRITKLAFVVGGAEGGGLDLFIALVGIRTFWMAWDALTLLSSYENL